MSRAFVFRRAFRAGAAAFSAALAALLAYPSLAGGGEGAFRGGAARVSAFSADGPKNLSLVWKYVSAIPPDPAWDAPGRFNRWKKYWISSAWNYDDSFQAVSAAGKVFFASSSDCAVRCLDLETGKRLWIFEMEAPSHLAPTVSGGYCLVASDDGYLYALDAATGKLKWKHSPAPDAPRIPFDGHLISTVPLRCGVAVENGLVYLASGLFPLEGTYLSVLDLKTGTPKLEKKIARSPQGYIALTADAIVVPNGRAPAVSYKRGDGVKIGVSGRGGAIVKNVNGGAYAAVIDGRVALGPTEAGTMWIYKSAHWNAGWRLSGLQLVDDGGRVFLLERNAVSELDRGALLTRKRVSKKWSLPLKDARTMIKAGGTLIIGGKGFVTLVDADTGKALGGFDAEGTISGLSFSKGRLIASSTIGTIYCLSVNPVSGGPKTLAESRRSKAKSGPLSRFLASLFKRSKGYCLIVEPADPMFPCRLAAANSMSVVCLTSSEKAAEKGRAAARANGLADRITYQTYSGKPPYRGRVFNAIVLDWRSRKSEVGTFSRFQRPHGGVLAVISKAGRSAPKGFKTKKGKKLAVSWRRMGALPGAGSWTHPYANPGNTLSGDDSVAFGKTGLLWFGRPGPHDMPDRHTKGAPPVYANGRIYVSGTDRIFALDAYNGTILWTKDIPDVGRVIMPRSAGNMVATDSGVYVAYAGECDFIEGDTGTLLRSIKIGGGDFEWEYVALSNGVLLGSESAKGTQYRPSLVSLAAKKWFDSDALCFYGRGTVACSNALHGFDPKTEKRLWTHSAIIPAPAIAADSKRVYLVETAASAFSTDRIGMAEFLKSNTELVALDLKTGAVAWKRAIDLKKAQWTLYLSVSDGVVLAISSGRVEVKGVKSKKGRRGRNGRIRYFLAAFDAATGKDLWNSEEKPAHDTQKGDHGELNQHPMIINGVVMGDGFAVDLKDGSPYKGWCWKKGRKCGLPTSSRNLVLSRNGNELVTYMADIKSGKSRPLCLVARSGCWVNVIPAGGIILVPEATSGCTCGYPVQTSRAFTPLENGK